MERGESSASQNNIDEKAQAASPNMRRGHESQKILFADGKEGRQAIGSNLLSRNSGENIGMFATKNTVGTRSGPLMFSNPAAQMTHY